MKIGSQFKPGAVKRTLAFVLLSAFALAALRPAQGASGHVLGGSPDAPVRIEVFSDFECPACRELYLEVMRRVLADYSGRDKVCVIYHEFPLSTHQFSRQAARYAAAAGLMGREPLLKVYDTLFMDQASWSENGKLEASLSKALSGKELKQLKQLLQDPGIDRAIDQGIRLGKEKQVTSTPTWFIFSGNKQLQKVAGRLSYAALKQYLETILK